MPGNVFVLIILPLTGLSKNVKTPIKNIRINIIAINMRFVREALFSIFSPSSGAAQKGHFSLSSRTSLPQFPHRSSVILIF